MGTVRECGVWEWYAYTKYTSPKHVPVPSTRPQNTYIDYLNDFQSVTAKKVSKILDCLWMRWLIPHCGCAYSLLHVRLSAARLTTRHVEKSTTLLCKTGASPDFVGCKGPGKLSRSSFAFWEVIGNPRNMPSGKSFCREPNVEQPRHITTRSLDLVVTGGRANPDSTIYTKPHPGNFHGDPCRVSWLKKIEVIYLTSQ